MRTAAGNGEFDEGRGTLLNGCGLLEDGGFDRHALGNIEDTARLFLMRLPAITDQCLVEVDMRINQPGQYERAVEVDALTPAQ